MCVYQGCCELSSLVYAESTIKEIALGFGEGESAFGFLGGIEGRRYRLGVRGGGD